MKYDDWKEYKSVDKNQIELRVAQLSEEIEKIAKAFELFQELVIKDQSKEMYIEIQRMLIEMEEE
tara:strand:- start:1469 stop:1663 length:195 start_codon:yes stop_codon:yes gene_type:complete